MKASLDRLSAEDLKDVLQVGRVALECNRSEELTREVLHLMEAVFKTSCSNFFFSLAWADELDLNRVVSLTIGQAFLAQFRKYYYQLDPFINALSLSRCPTTVVTEQIVPYGKLTAGEYYNDFLKPQSIYSQMSIFLRKGDGLLGSFNLFRGPNADVFTSKDRAKAELMAPYLAEALSKIRMSEKTATQTAMIDKILLDLPYGAVVLMNEWYEPIYCSDTAKEKLNNQCNATEGSKDCLRYLSKVLSDHFGSQTAPALGKRKLKLQIRRGKLEIVVRLVRMGIPESTFFAVYLESEGADSHKTQEEEKLKDLGLTPRERDVVRLLSEGLKNPEIGKRLFISEYTVENHLRSIFKKMGVSNRTAATNRLFMMTKQHPSLFWHC